jgi:hypothetical protein
MVKLRHSYSDENDDVKNRRRSTKRGLRPIGLIGLRFAKSPKNYSAGYGQRTPDFSGQKRFEYLYECSVLEKRMLPLF